MRQLFFGMTFLIPFFLLTANTLADDAGPSFQVDLSDAINHYATVTMTAESTGESTQVMMATWTPGSYLVREYAKHVDSIVASDAEGKSLPIEKISKNRWQIQTGKSKSFQVKYHLYCNERSVRTNWLGLNYGVLNGAATFLTIPEQLERPHRVTLQLPKSWKKSATSLRSIGDESHRYQASSFHELVDSPIAVGNMSIYPFKVAGVEHQLVNINELSYYEGEKGARDLAKIVAEQHKVWGKVPYDRYLFLNMIGTEGGGLEHDNSTLLMSGRFGPTDEASYKKWLGLASHEFFHAWNVRRLRPKALVKYDYETEIYTPSLWVAEGITSYYEDLILVRAGLISQDDFIKKFATLISGLQQTEGRKVQSLRDSSHDAWIKYYRPAPNSTSTQISYYTKGAVVGFLLDAEIRSASDGKASLDDAMRILFEKFSGPVGFTPSDFREICNQVAGKNLDSWFATSVDSTDELDYQVAADWYGIEFGDIKPKLISKSAETKPTEGESKKDSNDKEQEGKDKDADSKVEVPKEAEPKATDTKVARDKDPKGKKGMRWLGIGVADSPATKAGLADSDEILAINGVRIRSADEIPTGLRSRIPGDLAGAGGARPRGAIETKIQEYEIGEPIKILISRDDTIHEILATVGSLPEPAKWSLAIAKSATPAQKQHLAEWLKIPKPAAKGSDKAPKGN